MIDTTTAMLMIGISMVFFIVGLIFKKNAYVLSLFGGIMLLLTGVIILSSPIQYKSGSVISTDVSNGNNIITNTYVDVNSNFNNFLGGTLILVGLGGFLGSIFGLQMYSSSKKQAWADSFE